MIRVRRALAAALALVCLFAAAAQAALDDYGRSVTVVRSPETWDGDPRALDCVSGDQVAPSLTWALAAGASPGAGALSLGVDAGEYGEYSLPTEDMLSLDLNPTYDVRVRSSTGTVRVVMGLDLDGGDPDRWVRLERTPTFPWLFLDLRNSEWEWLADHEMPWSDTAEIQGVGTLDEWQNSHGDIVSLHPMLVVDACDAPGPVTLDLDWLTRSMQYGAHTMDFEPAVAPTPTLTRAWSKRRITAGDDIRLRAQLHHSTAVPVAGRHLRLRALGTTTSASATTTHAGWASLTRTPRHNRRYRWSFAGDAWFTAAAPVVMTVGVHTQVFAEVADATLRRGDRLVVTGRTGPASPGSPVTLWRRTDGGKRALATATVGNRGRFRLSDVARRAARWSVFVTVPADKDNLAGRSASHRIRIR